MARPGGRSKTLVNVRSSGVGLLDDGLSTGRRVVWPPFVHVDENMAAPLPRAEMLHSHGRA